MASLRHTVSVAGAGASLRLSTAAGAASARGMLPWSLPVLTTAALVWSFARTPLTAVPEELAEPDRYPESLGRPSGGSFAAILRGNFWMGLDDEF